MQIARTTVMAATLAVLTASVSAAAAQQQDQAADPGVQVTRAAVATGVEDREPVGEAVTFPADVGGVYFYTVFEGDFPETRFEHVWLREGEEVARIPIRAAGPRWRTWSRKTVPADWAGAWSVKVVDADGNELSSVDFAVGEG